GKAPCLLDRQTRFSTDCSSSNTLSRVRRFCKSSKTPVASMHDAALSLSRSLAGSSSPWVCSPNCPFDRSSKPLDASTPTTTLPTAPLFVALVSVWALLPCVFSLTVWRALWPHRKHPVLSTRACV